VEIVLLFTVMLQPPDHHKELVYTRGACVWRAVDLCLCGVVGLTVHRGWVEFDDDGWRRCQLTPDRRWTDQSRPDQRGVRRHLIPQGTSLVNIPFYAGLHLQEKHSGTKYGGQLKCWDRNVKSINRVD